MRLLLRFEDLSQLCRERGMRGTLGAGEDLSVSGMDVGERGGDTWYSWSRVYARPSWPLTGRECGRDWEREGVYERSERIDERCWL